MPLPVILVFERHQDPAPKQALIDALPILKSKGYTKIAVEVDPSRADYAAMIAGVESQIARTKQLFTQALQLLSSLSKQITDFLSSKCSVKWPLTEESLKTMDYPILLNLLRMFVSSQNSPELVRMFKNYDGLLKIKELLFRAREHGFEIIGIDSKVCDLKIQEDLALKKETLQELDDVANARELEMSVRLLLQSQDTGVIGLIGALHYNGIKFYSDKLNLDCVCIGLYSQRNFVSPDKLNESSAAFGHGHIPVNLLYNSLFPLFITKLISFKLEQTDATNKVDNTVTRFLQDAAKPGAKVIAHHDADYYVDVEVKIDDHSFVKNLQKSGVYFYQLLKRGEPTIFIPAVNVPEQISFIQRLTVKV